MKLILTQKVKFPTSQFHQLASIISQDIQVSIDEQSLISRRPRSFIPVFNEMLFTEKKLVTEGFELISKENPLLFIIHLNHPIHGRNDVSVKITPFYAEFESTMNQQDLRSIGYLLLKVYEYIQ